MRTYYQQHKTEYIARSKAYYLANKEKVIAREKERREKGGKEYYQRVYQRRKKRQLRLQLEKINAETTLSTFEGNLPIEI